jgi:DNA gyrase subunit B
MSESDQEPEELPKLQHETDGPGRPPGRRPRTAVGASNQNPNNIPLEAVRRRPSMYIGSTGPNGLHHLVWEILNNSVDEALCGFCTEIEVTIHENNAITIEDNGRGIPTCVVSRTGKSAVETVFTVLHAGDKFGGGGYKVSGGLHGVGAAVVNALSERLEVTVFRDGKLHKQVFERGNPITKLEVLGESDKRGTEVTFRPDNTIFHETNEDGEPAPIEVEWDVMTERLREMAFLNKRLTIKLKDLRNGGKSETYFYERGIANYVE